MTNFKTTVIATAFIAFGALSISSLTAKADITGSLAQCKAFSAEKVVRCCDHIIKTKGRPFWMVENNESCQSSVSCTGAPTTIKYLRRLILVPTPCKVNVKFITGSGSSGTPPGKPGTPPNPGPVGVIALVKGP